MNADQTRARSLRRRLFTSHLAVILVALVVLGLVVGLVELVGNGSAFGRGRGSGEEPRGLVFGVIAAAVAAAIVSWFVSKRLASPLEEVSSATREMAAGNYNVRLPLVGTHELDLLVTDVNQLALELDTTEQRRLRLIGDVAHELRNPLSTIEGSMEALLDGVLPADDDTYARIAREAARLRRLADDLSSLSAAGEVDLLKAEPVDLGAAISDVVAQLEPQALAKQLSLSAATIRPQTVMGDQDRITQVLMNVIGNAVQYTASGEITVTQSSAGAFSVIEVADTGRGLAAEDQVRIFDRFHRVDEHFADGTGVGLAIAKLIVDAHGGTISAHSAGLGAGTTIRIELPEVAN